MVTEPSCALEADDPGAASVTGNCSILSDKSFAFSLGSNVSDDGAGSALHPVTSAKITASSRKTPIFIMLFIKCLLKFESVNKINKDKLFAHDR
jgi:hypothetical protein